MDSKSLRRRMMILGTAGALLLATTAPTLAEAPGAESPEALVERARHALENENMGEFMACLSPDARTEMAQMIYLMGTMVVGFSMMGAEMATEMGSAMAEGMNEEQTDEEKAEMEAGQKEAMAEVNALVERYDELVVGYGLPPLNEGEEPPEEELDAMFASIDHGAFVQDMTAFVDSLPNDEESPGPKGPPPVLGSGEGTLTDLAIDGDAATAKIDGQDAELVRIDGRWYFDAKLFEGPGGP